MQKLQEPTNLIEHTLCDVIEHTLCDVIEHTLCDVIEHTLCDVIVLNNFSFSNVLLLFHRLEI